MNSPALRLIQIHLLTMDLTPGADRPWAQARLSPARLNRPLSRMLQKRSWSVVKITLQGLDTGDCSRRASGTLILRCRRYSYLVAANLCMSK
jgi:hypothetical protein